MSYRLSSGTACHITHMRSRSVGVDLFHSVAGTSLAVFGAHLAGPVVDGHGMPGQAELLLQLGVLQTKAAADQQES